MQLNVSAQTIDLVVGVYLLINLVIGYQRGLFARLYDLLSTILVFVIAVNIATPLAHNIHFYSSGSDLIAGLVEPTVNYLMALVASIIVLYILKLLLGHILKPFFKHLKESSHFTSFAGGLLGMAFSLVKSLLICYVALAMVLPTLYTNGQEKVAQTSYAHMIVDLLPSYSGDLSLLTDAQALDGHVKVSDTQMLGALMRVSLTGYSWHIISESQMLELMNNQFGEDIIKYGVTLNVQQKDMVVDLLNKSSIDILKRSTILSKIKVSE